VNIALINQIFEEPELPCWCSKIWRSHVYTNSDPWAYPYKLIPASRRYVPAAWCHGMLWCLNI